MGRPRPVVYSDDELFTQSEEPGERTSLSGGRMGPNIARVHNYLLGGKDHFALDRDLAHHLLELMPEAEAELRAVRRFAIRAARHLAVRRGVRQFLEFGMGYPGRENVHETAQRFAPQAGVVYVADDPIVLAHARALLATNDRVGVVEGRLHDPDGFMHHRNVRELLDFSRPVAVLLAGSMQFVPPGHNPHRIVAQIRAALSPGSYLVIAHPVARPEWGRLTEIFRDYLGESPSVLTKAQIAAFFDGLDLERPGLVPASEWHPIRASARDGDTWFYAGAGRIGDPDVSPIRPSRIDAEAVLH
ncbi:SAM-dependent methyltransferase [Actinomadura sp. 9N215]|uniref:SAM-dependent methyltransferase n=1 Tax=Actinomadura sp. 9N215 TaxID=3375150 RepID=UPI003797A4EE